MSTVCKICINSKEEEVHSMMLAYLEDKYDEVTYKASEWPLASEKFELYEINPTQLSIKQVTEDTTEIHYNCFGRVCDLAAYLTQNLHTNAVVNMYQSTSESCYWAYYVNGELLREIDSGDGEIQEENGIKLEFEGDDLGHNIAEDEDDPMYVFDSDDMDEYNGNVGIIVEVYQQYGSNWKNYKIGKPWWKFW